MNLCISNTHAGSTIAAKYYARTNHRQILRPSYTFRLVQDWSDPLLNSEVILAFIQVFNFDLVFVQQLTELSSPNSFVYCFSEVKGKSGAKSFTTHSSVSDPAIKR